MGNVGAGRACVLLKMDGWELGEGLRYGVALAEGCDEGTGGDGVMAARDGTTGGTKGGDMCRSGA